MTINTSMKSAASDTSLAPRTKSLFTHRHDPFGNSRRGTIYEPQSNSPKRMSPNGLRLAILLLSALLFADNSSRAQTNIWQESLDDGNGDSRWYPEMGVWQIGSPSVGPGTNSSGCRAHSCPNCVTTGLSGNYLPNQDSRFIRIASFVVPASTNYPHLRFWHWYSFAGVYCSPSYPYPCDEGSYGYVEIKPGAAPWRQITNSPTYSGSTCGAWWQASIDLSQYAGQTVQVAFHFHSAAYTDVGWYIDDVELVTNGPPVLNNPESFELGMGDWTTDYSGSGSPTWQIGVPKSGPPTNSLGSHAHGGTNCAATILAGSYCSYNDARLISPPFAVPASNSYPRLRFWHWYSFAGPYCSPSYPYPCDEGSYGYVEIKVGTNNWQQVAPTYKGSSSGVWTKPSIDLTPYAGMTVQVSFHFHSAAYTAVGWYIDDVAVATGTPVSNNPENLELGLGDWYAESGTWEVGVPSSGPGSAHGGTNCAATVLKTNYSSYVDSRFVSPAFTVPPCSTSPALRFWHWYNLAGQYCSPSYPYPCDEGSYGYVEIKVGTNNWQALSAHYTGQSGSWTQPFFNLCPYAGQTVQLAFHFHSAANVASGWYVDDVRIVHDFALLLLGSPVVRTQTSVCLSLGIAASSPATNVSFTLQAPAGILGNAVLNTTGCWSGTITPLANSEWFITLQSSCGSASMGVQSIGSLCFTAASTQSAFVPLSLNNLAVINRDGSTPTTHTFDSRAVVIANEPLLEASLGPNRQRWLTTFGKANQAYEIRYATNLTAGSPWTLGWTNTVPTTLFQTAPLQGTLSNAPILFLRANER
jgi:hypothetical protein